MAIYSLWESPCGCVNWEGKGLYTHSTGPDSTQAGQHGSCQNTALQVVNHLLYRIKITLPLLQWSKANPFSSCSCLCVCVCSSMLKEPVQESLQCLCALGLVHGDVTLASATLTELLKLGEPAGGAVEQRCLLTCTLLALQGNFSGVHREASRAIHRYWIVLKYDVAVLNAYNMIKLYVLSSARQSISACYEVSVVKYLGPRIFLWIILLMRHT